MEKLVTTMKRCDKPARARVMRWFVDWCSDEDKQREMLEAPAYHDTRQAELFDEAKAAE